jgi:hypothetical protein
MADLFDEVGDDLRREKINRLWQRYSLAIIGGAVLIVAGVAGWRVYEHWQTTRAAGAGDAYRSALSAAANGDNAAAADALVAFSSDAPADYARLARLRAGTERAAAGEVDTALSLFEQVAEDGSASAALRDLARLRAAMVAVDSEPLDQIRARVAGLDTPANSFRHAARELIAVAAVKAEAWTEARAALATLTGDPEVPGDYRQRAEIMEELIRSVIGPAPASAADAGS